MTEEFITVEKLKENMGIKEEPELFAEVDEDEKVYDGKVYICGYCGATKHPEQVSACEHSNSSYIECTAKVIPKEKTKEASTSPTIAKLMPTNSIVAPQEEIAKGEKKEDGEDTETISFLGNLFFVIGWMLIAILFLSEMTQGISYPLIALSVIMILFGARLMWKSRSKNGR
jgi:hypothetical protein